MDTAHSSTSNGLCLVQDGSSGVVLRVQSWAFVVHVVESVLVEQASSTGSEARTDPVHPLVAEITISNSGTKRAGGIQGTTAERTDGKHTSRHNESDLQRGSRGRSSLVRAERVNHEDKTESSNQLETHGLAGSGGSMDDKGDTSRDDTSHGKRTEDGSQKLGEPVHDKRGEVDVLGDEHGQGDSGVDVSTRDVGGRSNDTSESETVTKSTRRSGGVGVSGSLTTNTLEHEHSEELSEELLADVGTRWREGGLLGRH